MGHPETGGPCQPGVRHPGGNTNIRNHPPDAETVGHCKAVSRAAPTDEERAGMGTR
jgi:hypothetical protein